MPKLKLTSVPDDRPVKVTIELPAAVYRDLAAYAEVIGREGGQATPEPAKLIVPMIQRFMATDRAFAKVRRLPRPFGDGRGASLTASLRREVSLLWRRQPVTRKVSTIARGDSYGRLAGWRSPPPWLRERHPPRRPTVPPGPRCSTSVPPACRSPGMRTALRTRQGARP